MDPRITADPYWQSAQKLAAILKDAIAISPDNVAEIAKIPPQRMSEALDEMCKILSFMETDTLLYERIEEARKMCPEVVARHVEATGMSVDELFGRFMQFEQAVIKEASINYDFGRLMMAAVQSKREVLSKAFRNPDSVNVEQIRLNVVAVRKEVCRVAKDLGDTQKRVDGFIRGRLMTTAGVEISINNMVAAGVWLFVPDPTVSLPLSVGSYMSKMAGGIFAMLPSSWRG